MVAKAQVPFQKFKCNNFCSCGVYVLLPNLALTWQRTGGLLVGVSWQWLPLESNLFQGPRRAQLASWPCVILQERIKCFSRCSIAPPLSLLLWLMVVFIYKRSLRTAHDRPPGMVYHQNSRRVTMPLLYLPEEVSSAEPLPPIPHPSGYGTGHWSFGMTVGEVYLSEYVCRTGYHGRVENIFWTKAQWQDFFTAPEG